MTFVTLLALAIFIFGYIGITLEHKIGVNKAAFALLTGSLLWVLVGIVNPYIVDEHMLEAGYDIFSITIFLLGAMSLVEILIHYRLFDVVREKITKRNFSMHTQFYMICALAFILSGIIDNMTATIVLIQIARRFFWGRNLLTVATAIVIVANAGGAFSPIGDVTTIMLWIAGKFSAIEIIMQGVLPAIAIGTTATLLLGRKIKEEVRIQEEVLCSVEKLTRGEAIIVGVALFSFLLPIFAKMVHLPPVVGILLGVGITWLVADLIKSVSKCRTHLTASIENLVQKSDIASIKFFVGILLAVSALSSLGILEYISQFVFGYPQTTASIISGTIVIGMVSSVLDNIPLTAIAIEILQTTDTSLWVLLALSVGTGGSLLAIGSAAGVIAMGMIKELSFKEYFKIGFVPALVSFLVGICVWGATSYTQVEHVAITKSQQIVENISAH